MLDVTPLEVEALQLGYDILDIEDLMRPPAWYADALCREPAYAHVNWFPERGESLEPARQVCTGCLVRDECASYAATFSPNQVFGVWGGLSSRERKRHRLPNAA